jgi:secondary thiamine-phosphate synthase enzyme
MSHHTTELSVETRGAGLVDVTAPVVDWAREREVATGLLTVFIRHTSASLVIQENADPDVLRDIESFFGRLVPAGPAGYRHTMEGPDDMPAHIRCALTQTALSIPVVDGRPVLGTWQGIYVYEHRRRPHRRRLVLHLSGD